MSRKYSSHIHVTITDVSAINIFNLQLSSNYAGLVHKCDLSTLCEI